MTVSTIDPLIPATGASLKASGPALRANFAAAKADIDALGAWQFNVGDYSGTGTDPFDFALDDLYAAGSGRLVIPRGIYTPDRSIIIDPEQLTGPAIIEMAGARFEPSHSDWCIDVPTNFFGPINDYDSGKPIIIRGNGARIVGQAGMAGGIRLTDTNRCEVDGFLIHGYTEGDMLQCYVSSDGDYSTWFELNSISNIRGYDVARGLVCTIPDTDNPAAIYTSFDFNSFRNIFVNGTVDDCILYRFDGDFVSNDIHLLRGWKNQDGVTGCIGFYLNGLFNGTHFRASGIDLGADADTDIVFGPRYADGEPPETAIVDAYASFDRYAVYHLPPGHKQRLNIEVFDREVQPILTHNTGFYVRSDGDDDNDGLSDTADGAKLTIAAAIEEMTKYQGNGWDFVLQLEDGTWTEQLLFDRWPAGCKKMILQASSNTPGSVVIHTTSDDAIYISGAEKRLYIGQGIELRTTTSGFGVDAEDGAQVFFSDSTVQIGACADGHLRCDKNAEIFIPVSITFTGNAPIGVTVGVNSTMIFAAPYDASGRAYSSNFASVRDHGVLEVLADPDITGSTGSKGYIESGGLIRCYNGGPTNAQLRLAGNVDAYAETGQFAQIL